jgi:DNA-binding IclR family transcriptional regulator
MRSRYTRRGNGGTADDFVSFDDSLHEDAFGKVMESDGSGVKSAERALTILELFSQPNRALTFTQVAEMLGYPRSSLHGLLRTLTDRGWLRLDPRTRRFSLGLRAWEAGHSYRPVAQLIEAIRPEIEQLRTSVDGTVYVAVLDGGDSVCVMPGTRRAAAHIGGAGRVLLAQLDRSQVEQRLGADPGQARGSRTDVEDLHRTLDQVREQDWAEAPGEHSGGVSSLAVPLRDRSGSVVAALGIAAPVPRMEAHHRDRALQALRAAAERLTPVLEPPPA